MENYDPNQGELRLTVTKLPNNKTILIYELMKAHLAQILREYDIDATTFVSYNKVRIPPQELPFNPTITWEDTYGNVWNIRDMSDQYLKNLIGYLNLHGAASASKIIAAEQFRRANVSKEYSPGSRVWIRSYASNPTNSALRIIL